MAKTGLGKGLGALLSENVNIEAAPQTQSVIKEINTKATNHLKVTPDYVVLTGDRIRGVTFQNGYMVLTQSYGGAATLLFKELSIETTPADTTVKLNGVDVPVWDVYLNAHSYSINTMKDPLQICNINDDLLLVFGSGARYYSDTIENATKDKATEFAWKLEFPTIA